MVRVCDCCCKRPTYGFRSRYCKACAELVETYGLREAQQIAARGSDPEGVSVEKMDLLYKFGQTAQRLRKQTGMEPRECKACQWRVPGRPCTMPAGICGLGVKYETR